MMPGRGFREVEAVVSADLVIDNARFARLRFVRG
jgi:hypothetical protein